MSKKLIDINDPNYRDPMVLKIAQIVTLMGYENPRTRDAILSIVIKNIRLKAATINSREVSITASNSFRVLTITRSEIEKLIELNQLRIPQKEAIPDPSSEILKKIIDDNMEVQAMLLAIENEHGWKSTGWFLKLADKHGLKGIDLIREFERYAKNSGDEEHYAYLSFISDILYEFKTRI